MRKKIKILRLIWVIFSCLLSPGQLLASVITQIEFVGNEKTKPHVLLQEMQSKLGGQLDIQILKKDMQAIMDLGLYRDVQYYLFETDSNQPGEVKLVIEVKEKRFLFILPDIRFDEVEHEIRYGVRAYWDNIGGYNHRLRLKVREHGNTLGVQDLRQKLSYFIPRINGSAYNLDVFSQRREAAVEDFINPPQLRHEIKHGFNLSRWHDLKNRSSGFFFGAGLHEEARKNEALNSGDISRPDFEGRFLELHYGFKRVNQYLFNRRGKEYGYKLSTTRGLFESENNYTKHLLYYRSYYRLKSQPLNNLNVQLQLGASEGDYLGDTEFSLGGKNLRGYEKDEYTGNAMLLMNMEYLIPFTNDPAYRYGLIFDLGNTYDRFEEIDFQGLHPSIGIGFRWKLAAFVKVNIRMDIGYAVDTGDTNILLNSRHLF